MTVCERALCPRGMSGNRHPCVELDAATGPVRHLHFTAGGPDSFRHAGDAVARFYLGRQPFSVVRDGHSYYRPRLIFERCRSVAHVGGLHRDVDDRGIRMLERIRQAFLDHTVNCEVARLVTRGKCLRNVQIDRHIGVTMLQERNERSQLRLESELLEAHRPELLQDAPVDALDHFRRCDKRVARLQQHRRDRYRQVPARF